MKMLQAIDRLEIESNKMFYDKKTEILSIYIFDFVFIGSYKKSSKLSKVLDDLHNSFGEISLSRENLLVVDFVTHNQIRENTKLKNLKLLSKKEIEKEKEEPKKEIKIAPVEEKEKFKSKKAPKVKSEIRKKAKEKSKDIEYDYESDEIGYEKLEEEVAFDDSRRLREPEARSSMAPSAPKAPPPPPGAGPTRVLMDEDKAEDEPMAGLVTEPLRPTVYEINMGLQYYSVMMEQMSYLFYIYFSHKELKIVDEEGKTVFKTTIRIETLKKEPPILNLRVEGEGFEVHPLYGRVEVKKDAVNPPVMIFSILPIKKKEKTKKEKKEGERRFLHVYIDYEEKTINHTILSIIVQPKHFHLDLGPIHLNVSKKIAAIISFLSVIVAIASLVFTIFSIDTSSTFLDVVTNFAPGLGSIVFIVIFLITLFKEGIYPLKEKISYFLNFDKTGILIK
ncbi:MAG: hypothetical protein ACFFBY_11690 [Promethearchaeota archaeon]